MATRKPDQPSTSPGGDDLARIYHAASADNPSPALDARILSAARAAAAPSGSRPQRWAVPLSTAAVVVLAVGLVLFMTKQGALNHSTRMDMPSEYDTAPASPPAAVAEAPLVSNVPEAAAPLAKSVEPSPAKRASADKMKKAEAPAAVVTAPKEQGASHEADRLSAAREEKARARSTVATGALAMKPRGADVTAVQVSGSPGSYSFDVTVRSPDTGCSQYADWWEVLGVDGTLLYRRVLFHSHVGEQPFTRDGGPVPVQAETVVWVRAHMSTTGYGGAALKGSVKTGFKPAALDAGFAAGATKQQPLPDGCAF